MSWLLALVVLVAIAAVMMTRDERLSILQGAAGGCRDIVATLAGRWKDQRASGRPLPLATAAVVLVTVLVFTRMLLGEGPLDDPQTIVAWGGSVGPRTTNGEWWRLVAATFVHDGPLHLLATLAGLALVGSLTERLVGRPAFLSVYLAAGTLATLVGLYVSPVDVTSGAGPAILGICGLLTATLLQRLARRAPIPVSWREMARLLPGIGLFLLYSLVTARLDRASAGAALTVGALGGLLLARGRQEPGPALRQVAALTAAAAAIVVVCAVPLRGLADIGPALDRIRSVEERTAGTYRKAVDRFTKGTVQADALVVLIDETIVPELRAAHAGLGSLERVPAQHQPVVASAEEYFRLRLECWRLRVEALRTSRMRLLQEADAREWQALAALKKTQVEE